MPPVTTGKKAAKSPPTAPANVPCTIAPGVASSVRATCWCGTSTRERRFCTTHGMAKSPTKAGSRFWKATATGTRLRYSRMKPSTPESRNVTSPATRLFHPSHQRRQPAGARSEPLGHSESST